ncbi:MAG: DnaJ domain-containing protein [Bacillota bacterium]|nr:DnaJ domain-containing protein [Bacillota bacterium]
MNPYEVLGISENASEEEIKRAYKEMVKKYHPDKYQNNPLADLAEEKLQEVNEAYDMLMKNGNAGGGSRRGGTPDYMQVRRLIDANRLGEAENILNGTRDRSAEWFFLAGMVSYKKGWYDDARNKLQTAAEMDPGNVEYSQAYGRIINMGGQFRNQAYGRGYNSQGNDDLCCQALQCYICADCCCDCI